MEKSKERYVRKTKAYKKEKLRNSVSHVKELLGFQNLKMQKTISSWVKINLMDH